jgi:hypothetical protein
MKAILPLVLCGLLSMSGLAAAQDVKYNYDPTVNFAKYHTYEWVSLPTAYPDQLVDKEIRRDIEAQLAAKGLVPATGAPDIQVGYQISIDQERQWDTWGGWGMGTATSSIINIGTLGIEFFDPAMKSLVWRGIGTKTIDPSGNPQKNMERMEKAIAKILKHFPPPEKK